MSKKMTRPKYHLFRMRPQAEGGPVRIGDYWTYEDADRERTRRYRTEGGPTCVHYEISIC